MSPVGARAEPVSPSHVVSVYGADSKGIVHSISAALAGHGVDITDLETKLAGTPEAPVYVMVLEIALGARRRGRGRGGAARRGCRARGRGLAAQLDADALSSAPGSSGSVGRRGGASLNASPGGRIG